jgi:hypothetical protein
MPSTTADMSNLRPCHASSSVGGRSGDAFEEGAINLHLLQREIVQIG